jgi:exonuclease VII small subunit
VTQPTVFISYSHKDEKWKDRLVTHLGVLHNQGLLDLWDDRRIGTGEDWYQEIQEAMAAASVAVLLVSANFLTSQFILGEEVPRLLERRDKEGLRTFPVIVKPCAWTQVRWLARMQVRPKDGRPLSAGDEHQIDADLTAIAEEVAAIISRAIPVPPPEGYIPIGPERISLAKLPSTSPDLFGRDKELAMLNAAWEDPQTHVVSLLARAELRRVTHSLDRALADLEQALSIATRGGIRLHEADCHLEHARLHLARGEKEQARESLAKAKEMIEDMGYHRRDNDLKDLEEQLGGNP